MIVDITKLKEAVIQCMEEINDGCYALRLEGLQVLLPEKVKFGVAMVTGTDINAVSRSESATEADGTTTSLTEQLAADTSTVTKNGTEGVTDTKTIGATSQGTIITHPTVTSRGSGGDGSTEIVEYEYESAD